MSTEAIILSAVTFVSTLCGGIFCLHKKERQLLMAFVAGILLGTIFFELLPEVTHRTHILMWWLVLIVIGSFRKKFKQNHIGIGSAILLCVHSFFDGLGIGVGFLLNPTIGILIAVAVIAHDFSDGINTVSIMLSYGNNKRNTIFMLVADAIAPVFGVVSTFIIQFPKGFISEYISFFCAFLFYIVVFEIVPQLICKRKILKSTFLVMIGIVSIFVLSKIIE